MRILVVEDDDVQRGVLIATIHAMRLGAIEFAEASNGKDGYFKYIHWHPDIVITDYDMPEISGHQLALLIRSREDGVGANLCLYTARHVDQVGDPTLFDKIVRKGVIEELRAYLASFSFRSAAYPGSRPKRGKS